MPWIGKKFVTEYLVANYVGESFSNLIPSILGLIQGIGQDKGCFNTTITKFNNETNETFYEIQLEHIRSQPRFSILVYYLIIAALILISIVAFTVLVFTEFARKHYRSKETEAAAAVATVNAENKTKEMKISLSKRVYLNISKRFTKYELEKLYILFLTFLVNFFYYGIMPGLQSYSNLPYGDQTFFLSVNLSKP